MYHSDNKQHQRFKFQKSIENLSMILRTMFSNLFLKIAPKSRYIYMVFLLCLFSQISFAQTSVKGKVIEAETGEPLPGATVVIKGTTTGAASDFDGSFEFKTTQNPPFTLVISSVGMQTQEVNFTGAITTIRLASESKLIDKAVEVVGQRIDDKLKQDPRTVENLDVIGIKQASAISFYDEAGKMKGVDLTSASLGFTIINTRGFNSTSPVRSLQIIDGVDNQSPGLNFSLGNFLGSSELDVMKMDLVVGANSAYYGPNAFNGVISMETKNPFYHKGLSASLKVGERNLTEIAVRWADAFKNKEGHDYLAYKLNFSYLKAYDWVANNYDSVYLSRSNSNNPGGADRVNVYGDEFSVAYASSATAWTQYIGAGRIHRTGYREEDLVDYNTKNMKANIALHWRTRPALAEQSPELILSSSMGNGTTVYQGDNRFSLRDIFFFQHRVEFRKRDKYFIRAYATHEDAGRSFDPYFTALLLQEKSKANDRWAPDYMAYWRNSIEPRIYASGYPRLETIFDPVTGAFLGVRFDTAAALNWYRNNGESLNRWHAEARSHADNSNTNLKYLVPGTEAFKAEFDRITSTASGKRDLNGGTRFVDYSALFHLHGEHRFKPTWTDEIVVGANGRMYRPNSQGTIFSDTAGTRLQVVEYGLYAGIEKKIGEGGEGINTFKKWRFNATLRLDKNQNFDYLFSPAVSMVWQPTKIDFIRASFSSAIRNPTLSDQYLFLNVGPAILIGSKNVPNKNFIRPNSIEPYLNSRGKLEFFRPNEIKPEKVQSLELGYRTTLWEKVFVDASYYYSSYRDFIGYTLGVDANVDTISGFLSGVQVYRFAANAQSVVTTQGFSIGLNYYFKNYYQLSGNYSWNRLNTQTDDPIIPAFNTPEHKFNIGISGRDVVWKFGDKEIKNFGFNFNYKWVQGFLFEGSPQFTGMIPTYYLLDGQINYNYKLKNKSSILFKLGASNILNRMQFQAYGGPSIGRLAYFGAVYEFKN